MSAELTNEEIREKLLEFNYNCGPVTDTTRGIYLKKLTSLSKKLTPDKKLGVGITDEELRAQLTSYGLTVAPITPTNRNVYLRRLEALKSGKDVKEVKKYDYDGCEPMEVDPPNPEDWTL